MFKLYARPSAGSAAVEALLTECGAAFEIIDILREPDGTVPRSYLQINPRGEVPTLRLPDNSIMTESAAMMVYLADLHPAAGLAPSLTSPLRGRYLRWMLFFATGVYMADLRMYFPARHSTDAGHAGAIKAKARTPGGATDVFNFGVFTGIRNDDVKGWGELVDKLFQI